MADMSVGASVGISLLQQAQQSSKRPQVNEVAAQQYNVMGMVSAANTAAPSNGSSTQTGGVAVGDPGRSSLASLLGSVQTMGTPPPPPPPSQSSSSTDGGLNSSYTDKLAAALKAKAAGNSQTAAYAAVLHPATTQQGAAQNVRSQTSAIFDRLLGTVQPTETSARA